MEMSRIRNQLSTVRRRRGIAAAALAQSAGITRQTIYAIEAGNYTPNTEVALRLARGLDVAVEELFSLEAEPLPQSNDIEAEMLSPDRPRTGQPVRICRIGERWIGVPASPAPYYLAEADGVVRAASLPASSAKVALISEDEALQGRLIVAGCDPAMGLLARLIEKSSGARIVPVAASSKLALQWLKDGKVHVAGTHLEDARTGDFNTPFIRRDFSGDFTIITFAQWEEGLVAAPGNPKQVRRIDDLTRKDVSFINRESGSGSRLLLDRLLRRAGIAPKNVRGYRRIACGHLAVAYAVATGEADCCLATRSAALGFGLYFTPLHSERYDFVLRRQTQEMPAARALFEALQRATLRRKLESLAGYDTTQTGNRVL
jgi:molybdate-binding protein/DNA-binding XRE family transcriptional regulator